MATAQKRWKFPAKTLVEAGGDSPNRSDYKGSATTDDGIEGRGISFLMGIVRIFSRDVYTEHPSIYTVIKG